MYARQFVTLFGKRPLAQQVAALFAAGENGGIGVLSDFSTMFQDAARSTPVTAAGQSVGSLLLKYGPGLFFTAAGAARPVLTQDANGFYYLATDGATQFMSCPFVQTGYPLTLAAAAKATGDVVGGVLSVTASVTNYHGIAKNSSANAWFITDRNAGILSDAAPVVGTNATPHVLLGSFQASSLEASMDAISNGATANSNAFLTSTTLFLGCLRSGLDFFGGRIYAPFVLSRGTAPAENTTIFRFLGGLSGVS